MKRQNKVTSVVVRRTWKQEIQHSWPLYVLILPSFVLAIIFCYIPMGGLVMAFQNYKPWLGITGSEFVGWSNFRQIFEFKESYQAIINTVIIAVSKIILGLVVPIIMALLLNEVRNAGLKKGIQTLVYLPHFLSWVTVAGMLRDILGLDGIVNSFLKLFGVEPIFFLGEAGMFRQIVVASDLWKGFGFGMIVYLAAISNIDQSLYEAAEMDGANRWQQTLHITLPGIMPMIIVMATLSLGNVLNAGFDQIFNLYSPLTYSTGDIIDTYVYRQSLVNGQYSFGTAVGLFKSGIGLALTAISYKIAYNVAGYRIF
ncbi:ABC transporter permease subunit [Acetatifactor muris]|uniref:Putative multiple-sugar transport system permease YteP n=1 Tax=Acetatifactor muris TaxID=879566 RepID=A0A2K4ZE40_9FIRM|nr:ABC transporter permease subunit [Acetatifactor muris]MCR2047107.1 ABC transporter permease subunit [Acetatifactor muris]SOY28714.1 putative multiple-sugar transport system permease YteP [Acetatifactor muris]